MVLGFGVSAECQSIGTMWQELLFGAYFELLFLWCGFLFHLSKIALDSEPRGRRYTKNTGHDRNHLYSMAIHSPTSMEKHYVQWFILKCVGYYGL